MHLSLKQGFAGLALGGLAALAQAQAPAGCVRISGEENPVAPDAYEVDGTPIFCAKPQGAYDPAAAQGYPQSYPPQGGYAPQAAPQGGGGWNGRLNTPLPGSQKQSGYGGGSAGGAGLGGSFQGRAAQGGSVTQGLGQSSRYGQSGQQAYGQSYGQQGYGVQGQSGFDPYGSSAGTYGTGSAQGGYNPYASQQPTTGSSAGYPGYDPYAPQPGGSTPQGSTDSYGPSPTAGSDPYGAATGSSGYGNRADSSSYDGYGSGDAGSASTPAVDAASPSAVPQIPVGSRRSAVVGGAAVVGDGASTLSTGSGAVVALPPSAIVNGTVPKLRGGNKLPKPTATPPTQAEPAPSAKPVIRRSDR